MPDIQDKIEASRKAGYTDDQIRDFLTKRPEMEKSRSFGYTDDQIFEHFGLKRTAGDVGRAPTAAGAAVAATPPKAPAAPTTSKLDWLGAVPRPQDFPSEYRKEFAESGRSIKEGIGKIKEGEYLKGALQTGLGTLGTVFAPVSAAIHTAVGGPVERLTGDPSSGRAADLIVGLPIPGPKIVQAAGAIKPLAEAGKTVEKILSPGTVSKEAGAAEALVRKETGEAARRTEQTRAALDEHQKLISGMDDMQKRGLISYIEGKSAGPLQPETHEVANKIRDAYESRRNILENMPSTQKMNFVENYFTHYNLWEPLKPGQTVAGTFAREGKTGFTKERSIPTIEEGIAKGLTPKTLDPIALTMGYIENADRFIATNRVFDEARALKTVKYYMPGKQPAGWAKVEGRLGEKGAMDAYAPEDWARVYNNFISKGFTGPARDVYDAAQKASNMVTSLELGLSAYHARTMAKEAVINEVSRGFQQLFRGDLKDAAKAFGGASFAPVSLPYRGHKLEKAYLGTGPATQDMKNMADLLTEAGGRAKGGARHTGGEYSFSRAGSYVTAFKRGQLKAEMLADVKDIKGAPILGTAKVFGRNLGRVMDTVAQPLFEKYIPKLKNGAFYENMNDWLRANPGAVHEDKVAAARQIWDSIDNRFGEMVQDNIFWDRTLKQSSMLAMRSYSWNMGTIRELGGGIRDIVAHRKMSQKAAYLIGLVTADAAMNASYQYLKTGEAPRDMQDLIAPRTGGVDAATGLPERAGMVGYMKDLYGWYQDPVQEAKNKIATAPRLVGELATNQDWRGAPIAPPADPDQGWQERVPQWLSAYLAHVASSLGPISVKDILKGGKEGSNIPTWERALGTRPAGRGLVDPQGLEDIKRAKAQREWKSKQRYEERQKSQYGGPQ